LDNSETTPTSIPTNLATAPVEATGWLSHTARGVLAGSLKKKLGLAIDSEKHDTRGRIYKVSA